MKKKTVFLVLKVKKAPRLTLGHWKADVLALEEAQVCIFIIADDCHYSVVVHINSYTDHN